MKKVMLFGGLGFIGKNFIAQCNGDYEIVDVSRSTDSDFINRYNIKHYTFEFGRSLGLSSIIEKEKPDFILNLVSIVTADRSANVSLEMIQSNIGPIIDLFHATQAYLPRLIINFGSIEEYGNISPPYKETDREKPNSPYALTKQFVSNLSMMHYLNYNIPVCVLRLGNVFGPYQRETKLIPYLVQSMLLNRPICTTSGEQIRDFIYVKDLILIIRSIIENHNCFIGEIVNVSYGSGVQLRKLIQYCVDTIHPKSEVDIGGIRQRENEPQEMVCTIEKLRSKISVSFSYTFFEALNEYIEIIKRGIEE